MSLENLPAVEFCTTDATKVESTVIVAYEAITGRKLYPGDPVRLLLESVSLIISQQRNIIDFAAKMNLLSYAVGDYLDVLGDLVGVFRLQSQPSIVTLEFTLVMPLGYVYTIPAGSVVTGGKLTWKTSKTLEIAAGDLTGSVTALCTTLGTTGNGLVPGQITTMVGVGADVDSVRNLTESAGGEDTESDENFRQRIRLAPSSFSVAGPADAYRFWARTANQAIIDVSVLSPSPGLVEVRPLMSGGLLPASEVLDSVAAVLRDDAVRPLSDTVEVLAPTAATYTIAASYWISTDDTAQIPAIQAAVVAAGAAYVAWQKAAIGRDINPSELTGRLMAAGCKRVDIISPQFVALDDTMVAQEQTVLITYQGAENA
jgi:phage-related baseplate assembly protein